MAILPLPQFEADIEADRKAYEALKTPKTLVVRFGVLKLVGEFANDSGAKPGCGSKMVVRTHRGTEIGEMLTSTCPNSGCSKSVSRQDMLKYIENSGGRDYPFFTDGRVLRVATAEDIARQSAIEQSRHGIRTECKRIVEELEIPIKVVDAEPILGDERLYIYYYSEDRVDLRDLPSRLARLFHNRIELRQVGARDEARVTADYERCGQYCCCKNFLKVLKPVSMKSAKIQKATLDPLKISGRCGRLMCCLRYEDETYDTLRKKLPKKKSRVGTPEGDGFVVDSQILTQLVLVQLDIPEPDGKIRQVAIPVENLAEPVSKTAPPPTAPPAQSFGRGPRSGPGPARGPGDQGARAPREEARGPRDGAREGGREGGREQNRDAPREQGRESGRDAAREPNREGGRDGGREGGRDGGRDGPRGDRRPREDRPHPQQNQGAPQQGQRERGPNQGRPPQDRPQGERPQGPRDQQRHGNPQGGGGDRPRRDRGPQGGGQGSNQGGGPADGRSGAPGGHGSGGPEARPRPEQRQPGPRQDRPNNPDRANPDRPNADRPGPGRQGPARGPAPRDTDDDFSPDEIDDLLTGPDDGDEGGPESGPQEGGDPSNPDGPRRKRRRRRRRGRGGPGGPGGGPNAGGPNSGGPGGQGGGGGPPTSGSQGPG